MRIEAAEALLASLGAAGNRTRGTEWPEVTHLGAPHPACDRQPEFHSQFGELIRAAVTAAVGGPSHAVTKGTTQPRRLGCCRELPTQPSSLAATSCGSQHFTAADDQALFEALNQFMRERGTIYAGTGREE
jgi:hypothetical protein